MKTLTAEHLAKVRALMEQLHSFTGLVEQIELANNLEGDRSEELTQLSQELYKGLEVACELTKALNQTALSIHLELLARRDIGVVKRNH